MNTIDHPRPQLRRDAWTSLDGEWRFRFDDDDAGRNEAWERGTEWDSAIRVPFSHETELSGIADRGEHPVVWYERDVDIHPPEGGERTVIHFEGIDYAGDLWINGRHAGSHSGPYSRFSADITDFLNDESRSNRITLRIEDSRDMQQPRGKQRWMDASFACWYVPTTGIWKSVWLETVGSTYLEDLKITPDVDAREVVLEYRFAGSVEGLTVEATVSFGGGPVASCSFSPTREEHRHRLCVEDESAPFKVHLWFPRGFDQFGAAGPQLYDLDIILRREGAVLERCRSYFGMRKVSIEDGRVLINDFPFYQKLILDQGYWPESGLTPPDESALIRDIDIILEAGYNGVRVGGGRHSQYPR
ncbi:MAG: glycoside hydrolase family 2, partial [Desulfobacterales bacterium]|nr:glycoside hydrolase family 2 [Desulfobacterales bacterium]